MRDGELFFSIKKRYVKTEYTPLIKLVYGKPTYDYNTKLYTWCFRFEDLDKVERVLGTIKLKGFHEEFGTQKVVIPKFKGEDFIQIIEYPKIFQVIEHHKQEGGEVKELKHNLDRNIIEFVWEQVIAKQPLKKPIRARTVAKNICEGLGITRFNRDTGSFQFDKFFGSRASYYKYYYLPMKVLVWQKKIKHYKNGLIERIK